MVTALAGEAAKLAELTNPPDCICVGTAWGPLEETHHFLDGLFQSGEELSSPMDFVGSVHNSPAGQAAILLKARGPNLTFSSRDVSFEQAVLGASLVTEPGQTALIVGADAWCEPLSPLLDPASHTAPSDGGAALLVVADDDNSAPGPRLRYLGGEHGGLPALERLLSRIRESTPRSYSAIFVGVPAHTQTAPNQLAVLQRWAKDTPVVAYRDALGECASTSAVAAAMALEALKSGRIPNAPIELPSSILLVTLGDCVAAMEVSP